MDHPQKGGPKKRVFFQKTQKWDPGGSKNGHFGNLLRGFSDRGPYIVDFGDFENAPEPKQWK